MWPTAASQFAQQFPSYSNRKCKKSPFSRTAAHIFVSPGYALWAITLNVVRVTYNGGLDPLVANDFNFI